VKRTGGIYEQISDYENLLYAFYKAAKGKQGRREVVVFRERLHENLEQLGRELLDENISLGEYRFFTVYEPKKRRICAAPFRERVLHHAIMNLCEPVFERFAIDDSYACRCGKGLHAALDRARFFAGRYDWFVKLDINKYFDSINHAILLALLAGRIKDERLLSLFAKLFDSYHVASGAGMPIGNLISQHCANLYLGLFDHWLKDGCGVRGYLRYMDDFIIFGETKRSVYRVLEKLRIFLANRLQLRLHPRVVLNRLNCGIPFLGFRVFPHTIRLSSRSRSRFVRKFKAFEQEYIRGRWDMDELNRHMSSLIGFTLAADCRRFRNMVIEEYGVVSEGLESR